MLSMIFCQLSKSNSLRKIDGMQSFHNSKKVSNAEVIRLFEAFFTIKTSNY